LGLTKTFGLHQVSFDLVGNVPLSAGNQNVEKGNSGSFNYKYAYALTSKLDVGIEGTIDRGWNGERNNAKVKNNYLEWYTGPALSYILPGNSWFQPWCGLGAYFPVYREYGQNTSAESVRVDFKLGLFW
jgi:hypothetical protein